MTTATPPANRIQGEQIRVRGLVQGVGFRPTVWRLATELNLTGWVRNDGGGVLLEVWGAENARDRLIERLRAEAPPLSRIESIERHACSGRAPADFQIIASVAGAVSTGVVPDAAVCADCLAELRDPADRRYRYPFINCTHCGPRFSIVRAVPYDRANTSMAAFQMCPACQAEYDDPADRRYHAQPNACPACGPRVWLEAADGEPIAAEDPIGRASRWLAEGRIIAIKGIGGFHLACDAANGAAVERLRQRKHRYAKPFALIARDLTVIERYARVSDQECAALSDPAAPIVLLDATPSDLPLAVIAPRQSRLGFMLPYSPLHHLLLEHWNQPLIMTSGNRSDEPQCIANGEARERLSDIADAFLMHDRDIVNRLDDSVTQLAAGQMRRLRLGRGYAPAMLPLPAGIQGQNEIQAMGAELKSTVCWLKGERAILSQHLGDLENAAVLADYRRTVGLYRQLFGLAPRTIAVDRHPDYLATQLGLGEADQQNLTGIALHHHHAHIAACIAENGWPNDAPPVLGIALDGLGLGDGGELWGGEFLLCDYRAWRRLAHFKPVPLLGGSAAMREPWRNTYAHLHTALGWQAVRRDYPDTEIVRFLSEKPLKNLDRMWARQLNSPLASSCGRLFDAVAAAVGICRETASHEGQAASELEAMAYAAETEQPGYRFALDDEATSWVLNWTPLWRELMDDLQRGTSGAVIAARFHLGLAEALATVAEQLCRVHPVDTCALSGGVFQNRLLLETTVRGLEQRGLNVLVPRLVPPNDGGIAFGQAVLASI